MHWSIRSSESGLHRPSDPRHATEHVACESENLCSCNPSSADTKFTIVARSGSATWLLSGGGSALAGVDGDDDECEWQYLDRFAAAIFAPSPTNTARSSFQLFSALRS